MTPEEIYIRELLNAEPIDPSEEKNQVRWKKRQEDEFFRRD